MFSSELIWQCIKKNTSFIKKSNGFTFTSEPFNILNRHSLKFSGLASKKSIGMELASNNNGKLVKKIKIVQKNSGSSTIRCPKKLRTETIISNNIKNAKKTIKSRLASRPDLMNAAIYRYRQIQKVKC
ncbi:60S ribosomal protein L28 [Cryptosporidium felis]|nr:60S ribosomal protein L28 [Cryptosporidium felis]